MKSQPQWTKLSLIAGLILLGAFSRMLPHPPNFTPIAAIALFAGATIPGSWLIRGLVPVAALLLSDLLIGLHSTMAFTYLAMIVVTRLGSRLAARNDIATHLGMGLSGSVVFFVITNLGVWLASGMYPHTLAGLGLCFSMAVPFFANTLAGTLVYQGALFGAWRLAGSQSLVYDRT